MLLGYFEGLGSERGMAWRAADSLAIRSVLGLELDEAAPDHSTISRTRRLIDVETHERVFTWVLERLAKGGLLGGKTIGIDATTLEANAAMRSIVRRDTGANYEEFLKGLAKASGIKTPTREALARLDRRRKKKASNEDWTSPSDPDAKITKMKDGRTHLAHKAEHAVDVDTGAIIAVTVQGADEGDTSTIGKTLEEAEEQIDPKACLRSWRTRATTAIGRWSISRTRGCVRTCRSRTEDAESGRTTSMLSKRCTPIAGASAVSEVSGYTGCEAS
jgi:transposase